MTGNAKKTDYSMERRKGSDFGAIFPAVLDSELRHRVALAIKATRTDASNSIDIDEVREIATYISELEETILRHHWGKAPHSELLINLKKRTGLDIKSQVEAFDALLSKDS